MSLIASADSYLSKKAKEAYYGAISTPGQLPSNRAVNEWQKALMHELYPNLFEYYFMAFELEDSEGKTTDRMVFPFLPTSFSENNKVVSTVTKTAGGIIDQFSTTLAPFELAISGCFGAGLKASTTAFVSNFELEYVKDQTQKDKWEVTKTFINPLFFTGFSAYNELKRIMNKSKSLDSKGKPYRTIFYNMAYSSQYYVRITNINGDMNVERNYQHYYSMNMKVIGVANGIFTKLKKKIVDISKLKKNSTEIKNVSGLTDKSDILQQLRLERSETFK